VVIRLNWQTSSRLDLSEMSLLPLAAVFSQDDLNEQSLYTTESSSDTTPLLHLSRISAEDSYDWVCIPLTNEAWKTRWKRMCLSDGQRQSFDTELLAENWRASEGPYERSEMNITRLGVFLML
jgi:type II protein arginine methyltransferase